MNREAGSHFESIESARDFVCLLSETLTEVKQEVDAEIETALDSQSPRRLQALRMVSYNLEKLAVHVKTSCRILNDLRSLRRLLCEERSATAPVACKAPEITNPHLPKPPMRAPAPATVVRPTARPGGAVAL